MISVLSIAGSDSSGGAGIQQDLKVFNSFKVHGATAITAVTAQNTQSVEDYIILSTEIIEKQIDSVMGDLDVKGVKTGMLANSEVIKLVRGKLKEYNIKNLVVDPVMVATSGDRLLDEKAIDEMKKFVGEAKISTPNIYEAEILTGKKITSIEDMNQAAKKIGNCVVKGGHLNATDILYWGGEKYEYPSKIGRKEIKLHGSGCAFSAAITACLAKKMDVPKAVGESKEYMDNSINKYFSAGQGSKIIDTGNIKLSESSEEKEKKHILGNIEASVERFVSAKGAYELIPEVGTNIAMALTEARDLSEVAGISGRIIRDGDKAVPVGEIMFWGTSHMGRFILTVRKYDPSKLAVMNIRYSEENIERCEKRGFSIAEFQREKEPVKESTMEWGAKQAISETQEATDIVYDRGDKGKEAMIRIIGKDAKDVVEKALQLIK